MAYTAESLFDYMASISDEVDEQYGTEYRTDEERQEYYQHIYDVLAARERQQESLWTADDDVLEEALAIMEDANYHAESTALIAYMHKMYGWEPEGGIQRARDYAPYLYE